MKYYEIKLNLSPNVIEKRDINYLFHKSIPNCLSLIFPKEEIGENIIKYHIMNHDIDNIKNDELFEKVIEVTHRLKREYKEIAKEYQKKGDVYYSEEFLRLSDSCRMLRKQLTEKYPFLYNSYKFYNDKDVNFEFSPKIGTGQLHIKKFTKIEMYLERAAILKSEKKTFYYEIDSETIFLDAKLSIEEMNETIGYILEEMNGDSRVVEEIGKITVIPKYEKITINGNYKQLIITTVYPNPEGPTNQYNILKEVGASKSEQKLIASDGEYLQKDKIEKAMTPFAEKGYLEKITNSVKTVFDGIIKITKKDF